MNAPKKSRNFWKAPINNHLITGDKWNDSTIKLILTNPHYVGDLVQGRTTTVSINISFSCSCIIS
nr:recombinase family protein [Metabacillus litoralis]